MGELKNQHYVPQFYLRRFANPKGLVHVYDKHARKSFTTPPRNIASEGYFYNLPSEGTPEGKDLLLVEKGLGPIEGEFSDALDELLAAIGYGGNSSTINKTRLAAPICLQFLRTKWFRQEFERYVRPKVGPSEPVDIHYLRLVFSTKTVGDMADTIKKFTWIVGVNESDHELFTSDHPVVRAQRLPLGEGDEFGFLDPGLEVLFPLNPKEILIMRGPSIATYFGDSDGDIKKLTSADVHGYNRLQILQSFRQIIAREGQFDSVSDVLAQASKGGGVNESEK